jgi:hypothetical protein
MKFFYKFENYYINIYSRKYYQYGREPLVFISTETGTSKLLTTLFSQTNRDYFNIDLIK